MTIPSLSPGWPGIHGVQSQKVPSAADLLAPQSLPSRDEELWVIQKKAQPNQALVKDDQQPGSGALMAKLPEKTEMVPCR